jgi:hypothetical protein
VNLTTFETRLRLLPCVVCWMHEGVIRPCQELHHAGDATDRNDWNQIPLCYDHHEGPRGIHGLHRRAFEARYKTTEMKLLGETRRLYAKEFGA